MTRTGRLAGIIRRSPMGRMDRDMVPGCRNWEISGNRR